MIHCLFCNKDKDDIEFTVVTKNKNGRDTICRKCRQSIYKKKVNSMISQQIIDIEKTGITKICKICGEEKLLSDFTVDRSLKDGHKTTCHICTKVRAKQYYRNSAVSKAKYREKHKIEYREYHRQQLIDTKKLVMAYYGDGKCSCVICGESRLPCLTIDHINGGGTKHRKSINITTGGGMHFYRWLINNNYPCGYRTLCWNCQFVVEDEKRKQKLLLTNH